MANIIKLTASDGSTVEFYDEIKAQGGVKDVYFSTDKTYVVAFYRNPTNANDKARLETLLGCIAKRFSFRTQMEITGMTYLHGLLKWWNGKDSRVLLFLSITKSSSLQELMPNGLSLRTVRKRTANGSLRQNSSTSSFLPIRKVHFCRVCICV